MDEDYSLVSRYKKLIEMAVEEKKRKDEAGVHVIVELFQGIIDNVTVFSTEEKAAKYYAGHGGPEYEEEDNPMADEEIHWYQHIVVDREAE